MNVCVYLNTLRRVSKGLENFKHRHKKRNNPVYMQYYFFQACSFNDLDRRKTAACIHYALVQVYYVRILYCWRLSSTLYKTDSWSQSRRCPSYREFIVYHRPPAGG